MLEYIILLIVAYSIGVIRDDCYDCWEMCEQL